MNSFHIIGDNENLGFHIVIRRIWRSGLDHVDAGCLISLFLLSSPRSPHALPQSQGVKASALMMLCRIDHPGPRSDALQDEIGSAG